MDAYLLLVFLHIVAAGALFAAVGVEVVALGQIRMAASAEQARAWLPSVQRPAGGIGHLAMLVIVGTGVWMMVARWGLEAWMAIALVSIIAMMMVAGLLDRAAKARLVDALDVDVGADRRWLDAVRDARLHVTLWLRVGLLVGVLGLMTLKPGWLGSVVVVVSTAALGGGFAAVVDRRTRRNRPPTDHEALTSNVAGAGAKPRTRR